MPTSPWTSPEGTAQQRGASPAQELHDGGVCSKDVPALPTPPRKVQVDPAPELSWDEKVAKVLADVNRQANLYFGLGMGLYGTGSLLLILFLQDKPLLLTLLVMFFFQLCAIFFGTKALFPCVSGAFQTGLLANREMVPAFMKAQERMEKATEKVDQAILDISRIGDNIHTEVKRVADALERPIEVPRRRLTGPPIPVEVDDGNGKAAGS